MSKILPPPETQKGLPGYFLQYEEVDPKERSIESANSHRAKTVANVSKSEQTMT